jgi:hypothetical protein
MTKNRIIGAIAALSLLAVPAVAAAHGSDDDHGHHHGRHHHHKHHGKKAKSRDVTGAATGTIASFADGELTIALPNGKSFTADVKRRTVILCKSVPVIPAPATASRHGNDDGNGGSGRGGRDDGPNHDVGDDHGNDPATSTTPASTTAPASTTTPSTTVPPTTDDHGNDDHHDGHGARCGTDALVAGTSVADAKLSLKGGTATWKKVVLVK